MTFTSDYVRLPRIYNKNNNSNTHTIVCPLSLSSLREKEHEFQLFPFQFRKNITHTLCLPANDDTSNFHSWNSQWARVGGMVTGPKISLPTPKKKKINTILKHSSLLMNSQPTETSPKKYKNKKYKGKRGRSINKRNCFDCQSWQFASIFKLLCRTNWHGFLSIFFFVNFLPGLSYVDLSNWQTRTHYRNRYRHYFCKTLMARPKYQGTGGVWVISDVPSPGATRVPHMILILAVGYEEYGNGFTTRVIKSD